MKNQDHCYCKHEDMLPQSYDKQTDIYEILHSTEVENNFVEYLKENCTILYFAST